MIAYISIICWILAANCNAIMDTLTHHYATSIFTKYNPKIWNPKISWKNKYKEGKKALGPAFFLSTGLLVAFTDAWHFFKSATIILLAVSLVMLPYSIHITVFDRQWLNTLTEFIVLGVIWNKSFNLLYNKILIKK